MNKSWTKYLAVAVVASCCMLIGCNNYEEQIEAQKVQIDQLNAENTELSRRNSDLQGKLTIANTELAQKNQRINDLESKLASKPRSVPRSSAPPGWIDSRVGPQVTIGSDLLFSSGRATLSAAGKQRLSSIASDLKGKFSGQPIRVYGFTDSDPIRKTKHLWKDNLDLSANRAMAVTRYLISRGISASQIETIGMGSTNYKASNSSKSGKAQNRRVEIYVIK